MQLKVAEAGGLRQAGAVGMSSFSCSDTESQSSAGARRHDVGLCLWARRRRVTLLVAGGAVLVICALAGPARSAVSSRQEPGTPGEEAAGRGGHDNAAMLQVPPAARREIIGEQGLPNSGAAPILQVEYTRRIPHDDQSFCEGLEALPDGAGFVESAGLYSQSRLFAYSAEGYRQGEELSSHHLDDVDGTAIFGEGITVLSGKVYQLTYKEDVAFVRDVKEPPAKFGDSFQVLRGVIAPFQRKEGWGMTNDGTNLIAGDGSDKLYYLKPETLEVVNTITVPGKDPNGNQMHDINELEYVDGLIYFNVWLQNFIGVFDVGAGKVTHWLDLRQIAEQESANNSRADVLNGIAFTRPKDTSAPRKMIVTGKLWKWLYELDYPPVGGGR